MFVTERTPGAGTPSVGNDAPPNHRDGVVHHTRAEAVSVADSEHFDGKTTE
jgi:hypothetical protein